jgi:hypothetical protein
MLQGRPSSRRQLDFLFLNGTEGGRGLIYTFHTETKMGECADRLEVGAMEEGDNGINPSNTFF